MAQRTGLEPATPGVTGRYSNRLNYRCVSLDRLRVNTQPSLKRRIKQPWLFNLKPDGSDLENMAQRTGLEPATPGVTGRYSNRLNYRCVSLDRLRVNTQPSLKRRIKQPWLFNLKPDGSDLENMAQRTGLEPATPGVTGRYSNRLNYRCASVQP